jgi:ribosomal protein S18 acetylase RimI-like enzyme
MNIGLRPAVSEDYDFCRRLYFTENQWILDVLHIDRDAHEVGFPRQWKLPEVRIITLDGADIGWLQTAVHGDAVFLAQIYIVRSRQRRGIGTEVLRRLIAEADCVRRPLQLDVVKINPALRLYQRLGFRITGEEQHKFTMTRDIDRPHAPSR